jgi:fumarate reductase flavoprotein subunit
MPAVPDPVLKSSQVPSWDAEFDIAIVGAGGCGLTAAIAAGERGASVVLLERDHRPTCNTARSGGMLPAAGTRLQLAAGIHESVEHFAGDIFRKNHDQSDRELTLHLCRSAKDIVEWLIDAHGISFELATDFLYPAHTEYRMHSPPERTGAALVADLQRAVRLLPSVQYLTDINGETLVSDGDGAVEGVVITSGSREYIKAKKIILACNGFAGTIDLVNTYCPEVADALYFGGPASTGEGIRWGTELGAATEFMDAYQMHATVAMPGETLVTYSITMEGGIHVNLLGKRFADETRGYSEHALNVIAQPERVAVVVYDERLHNLGLTFPDYRVCVDAGLVKSEPTLVGLANRFSLNSSTLAGTVAAYDAARSARKDEFGRTTFAELKPPYFGIRVTGALFHTQGGLKVDHHARVLKPDGSPIPNLYAGGGTAAGISGHGPGGYFSGNGLLTALGYGYLAGRHARANV